MSFPADENEELQHPLASVDRLIHEPARLVIMAVLSVVESGDFPFLIQQTGLTWGNLSSHLMKLEKGGYVEIEKEFKGKKPNTMVSLSAAGREAFRVYRQSMIHVFDDIPE